MNMITTLIAEKIKEALDSPAATTVTAVSTGLMGYLEIAYHVSQDALGWISLALGVAIGFTVLRIKLIDLSVKKLRLKRELLVETIVEQKDELYDSE